MLIRTCIAPSRYATATPCGREFTPNSPHQLYCSSACATRAHRRAAKTARVLRKAGLPVPKPGFPDDMAERLAAAPPAVEATPPPVAAPPAVAIVPPDAIVEEVYRLEALDAITTVDEDEVFRSLGYLPKEKP